MRPLSPQTIATARWRPRPAPRPGYETRSEMLREVDEGLDEPEAASLEIAMRALREIAERYCYDPKRAANNALLMIEAIHGFENELTDEN